MIIKYPNQRKIELNKMNFKGGRDDVCLTIWSEDEVEAVNYRIPKEDFIKFVTANYAKELKVKK